MPLCTVADTAFGFELQLYLLSIFSRAFLAIFARSESDEHELHLQVLTGIEQEQGGGQSGKQVVHGLGSGFAMITGTGLSILSISS